MKKQERILVESAPSVHEKAKRAAESGIANEEKAGCEEELNIASKELAFQNGENEKLEVELVIANNEIAFQNEEKEKRAAELII